jgi:hypothetical protein
MILIKPNDVMVNSISTNLTRNNHVRSGHYQHEIESF